VTALGTGNRLRWPSRLPSCRRRSVIAAVRLSRHGGGVDGLVEYFGRDEAGGGRGFPQRGAQCRSSSQFVAIKLGAASEQRRHRRGDRDFQDGRRVSGSGGGFGSQHVQGACPGRQTRTGRRGTAGRSEPPAACRGDVTSDLPFFADTSTGLMTRPDVCKVAARGVHGVYPGRLAAHRVLVVRTARSSRRSTPSGPSPSMRVSSASRSPALIRPSRWDRMRRRVSWA
jgi:hypothetical protein